jgi:hypothetical protein
MVMIVIFHFTLLMGGQSIGAGRRASVQSTYSVGGNNKAILMQRRRSLTEDMVEEGWQKHACFYDSRNDAPDNLGPLHNCTGRPYFFADT